MPKGTVSIRLSAVLVSYRSIALITILGCCFYPLECGTGELREGGQGDLAALFLSA